MPKQPVKDMSRRQALTVSLGTAGAVAIGSSPLVANQPTDNRPLAGKRVLVAVGDFSEGMETYYMVYRLMEEGITPVVAANEVKRLQMVVHDFDPAYSNYIETKGYGIQTEIAYQDVKASDYDALLIPGGRGPEEIRQYPAVLKIVRHFMDNQRPLGAMCHGPQVVWAAGSVKGRKMTCYPGIRPDLELAGATFVDQPSVIDGMLVTSRGWPDLPDFLPQFLRVMSGAVKGS
jgi:protease I